MDRYIQFSHTSDIGVRVFGQTLEELFENAAFAMFDIIADLDGIKSTITQEFELTSQNYEELLKAWLDELLYNFYTKNIIFNKFEIVKLSEDFISAKASGKPVADNRNRLKTEIKATTYYNLKIIKKDDYYEVDIVFDV